eukprot:CAMPEP_0197675916 /NCGR_PEP_ID=MMETSP1338-20131121/85826_1 /TAXON_ID=43686 ORGANISM="Pelagodinium beii, Strain RCC1491" /NCGR_SAMPLE_ID=MMETSP1338 /ASSEMBLY_ACC=CAM_ASM_000754 /LENGTH=129 /DNA_ID=CAMNT_0043256523 /DNA_START=261 /DNA_END=645 /DNA_ORIENTATION=-
MTERSTDMNLHLGDDVHLPGAQAASSHLIQVVLADHRTCNIPETVAKEGNAALESHTAHRLQKEPRRKASHQCLRRSGSFPVQKPGEAPAVSPEVNPASPKAEAQACCGGLGRKELVVAPTLSAAMSWP